MRRKGSIALAAIAIILALIIIGFFLISLASRQCNSNRDCSSDAYCGSDYECHEYPGDIVIKQNNFIPAAIIMGISIIIAAVIFRNNGQSPLKRP